MAFGVCVLLGGCDERGRVVGRWGWSVERGPGFITERNVPGGS